MSTPRVRVRRLPVYTFEEWRLAFHPNYFRAGERRAAGAEVRAGERRAAGAEVRAGAAGGASAPEPIELSRDADVADLLGGVFVELVKAGIGTAIGYAVATLVAGVAASAALPLVAGAAVIFAVGIALNVVDNDLEIKATVKATLNYAVDNIRQLTERIQTIDTRALERYKADVINSVTEAIIDTAIDEAKSWLRDKVPAHLIPSTPDFEWPKAPSLPRLPNFNLPKF